MEREEAQSNCDDLRADVRAVMKVDRSSPEVLHILCRDRVTSSSDQDMRALRRWNRAIMNAINHDGYECAVCRTSDCELVAWCEVCARPLCGDCWEDDEAGMPAFCGVGRCSQLWRSSPA